MPEPDDYTDLDLAEMDLIDLREDFHNLSDAVRNAGTLLEAQQAAEHFTLRVLDFAAHLGANTPEQVSAALAKLEDHIPHGA